MTQKLILKKGKQAGYYFLFFILMGSIGYFFYTHNTESYIYQKKYESVFINHPEYLPKSEVAKISSSGFMNLVADMYWLKSIQYIGGNAVSGEYKKYLYEMMNLITDLNPYFEAPYTLGQLLIPSSDKAYEEFQGEETLHHIHNGEKLGLKGISNFCDREKVDAIFQEWDLQEIEKNKKYSNPCHSYKIPYYLAFIYYFYLKDNESASQYYKVVTAQEDAPEGAKLLAAIMQGKGGEREKALYMFLSLAKSVAKPDEACSVLTQEIENVYSYLSENSLQLDGKLLSEIEGISRQVLPKLTEENESVLLGANECTNFLAKAIREINLMYLDQADENYRKKFPQEISAKTPERLKETGFIDFIPTDFQQYEKYGIIYRYSSEIQRFDSEMGN